MTDITEPDLLSLVEFGGGGGIWKNEVFVNTKNKKKNRELLRQWEKIRMNISALCPRAVLSNTNKKKQLTRG